MPGRTGVPPTTRPCSPHGSRLTGERSVLSSAPQSPEASSRGVRSLTSHRRMNGGARDDAPCARPKVRPQPAACWRRRTSVPARPDPRSGLRRDPEVRAGRAARAVRGLARRPRRGGRARRLPRRAGISLQGRPRRGGCRTAERAARLLAAAEPRNGAGGHAGRRESARARPRDRDSADRGDCRENSERALAPRRHRQGEGCDRGGDRAGGGCGRPPPRMAMASRGRRAPANAARPQR